MTISPEKRIVSSEEKYESFPISLNPHLTLLIRAELMEHKCTDIVISNMFSYIVYVIKKNEYWKKKWILHIVQSKLGSTAKGY